jgi:hypothetical protein
MSSLISPTQRLLRLSPGVFTPTIVRGLTSPDGDLTSFQTFNGRFAEETAVGETGSFRYDPIGSGIKSTQQLNVDWSLFQNHVFFNSAQVKVNSAFNKIFDRYPFDGTRKETELFFDQMTGYERYVYDNLLKNKGYLFFSGSNIGDTTTKGTWVTVKDIAGAEFPFLTENPNGTSRIDPLSSSVTFQFQIYAPTIANQNQTIFQKLNSGNQHGFGCFLSQSASTTQAELTFYVCSGSVNSMSTSINLTKGDWQPVTFVWDRTSGVNELRGYVSGTLYSSSSQIVIQDLLFATASLYIGTGSNVTNPFFQPVTTFSGALDEFRYFKTIIQPSEMIEYQSKSLYSQADLGLYFKFNEPSGSVSNIVLDYSGKGMHGTLNSYALNTLKVRNIQTASYFGESPMIYEDIRYCPVLFPDQPEVVTYRESLMTNAAEYDGYNPSIITKLVPKQYFTYGQEQAALDTVEGQINELQYGSEPNTAALGNTQTILSLLYMWASFFDEIKLFLDAFSTLRHVDYNNTDTVPDAFLKQLGDFYGLDLPPLFIGSDIDQFINGTNITPTIVNSEYTLQYLQNQIWRRILINANDILKSKGTIHSIKALLRSVGIEGDNIFRFKEYGGPTRRTLNSLRESRNEIALMLNFRNSGYFKTPYLSGSRIEPGYPQPVGSFVIDPVTGHNIGTTNVNDGLFTSGSWTYEGIYAFPGLATTSSIQSLVRIMSSGSANIENVLANLYFVSGSGLTLYVKPIASITVPALTMSIAEPDITNGQTWNVSFGRTRGDAINQVSSSYFLRVARNNLGSIVEEYTTSSYYFDNAGTNVWQVINTTNISGSFISIGSGSTTIAANNQFVNENALQTFDGRVSQVRWWSKDLTLNEWREHVKDFRSHGVQDPLVNFNFENFRSGSFEKLRGDWSMDQEISQTDGSGNITLFDFSQNNLFATGSLFATTSSVLLPERFYYSFISPNFDEAVTNEKVRVRSYQNLDNVLNDEAQYSQEAPVYEIQQEQTPEDNGKFSIDFSIVDSLNQDMIEMFSSLNIFNNILGDPNMMFSQDYPGLDSLQEIYFNRLTQKMNIKGFFDFYTWFNTNMGKFIEQLIPRKTRYNGINYVIQSHMLERPKVEYHFEDIYVGVNNRNRQKEVLLLQLFTGMLKKY